MKTKTIKCKCCQERGTPKNNSTIGYYCEKEACQDARIKKALEKGRQSIKRAVKETNRELRQRKIVTHTDNYRKDLQDETNKLARMIDLKFWNCCVDCDLPFRTDRQQHGAHFNDVGGHNSVRYHLDNIHAATAQCNEHSSKHKVGYAIGLETRYGKEYLEMVQGLPAKYPKIKLLDFEVVEKLKIVRKLIRTFDTFKFENAIQAREQLNKIINIYK